MIHNHNTYKDQGCRCSKCVEANLLIGVKRREREKRYSQRKLIDGRMISTNPTVRHGTSGAYVNWGCRCLRCTDIYSERNKKQYKERKEKKRLVAHEGFVTVLKH